MVAWSVEKLALSAPIYEPNMFDKSKSDCLETPYPYRHFRILASTAQELKFHSYQHFQRQKTAESSVLAQAFSYLQFCMHFFDRSCSFKFATSITTEVAFETRTKRQRVVRKQEQKSVRPMDEFNFAGILPRNFCSRCPAMIIALSNKRIKTE